MVRRKTTVVENIHIDAYSRSTQNNRRSIDYFLDTLAPFLYQIEGKSYHSCDDIYNI